MRQEVRIDQINTFPDGQVEVIGTWDGNPVQRVFPSLDALVGDSGQMLVDQDQAIRAWLFYTLQGGANPATLADEVGAKLVLEVAPAVQQTIALVRP